MDLRKGGAKFKCRESFEMVNDEYEFKEKEKSGKDKEELYFFLQIRGWFVDKKTKFTEESGWKEKERRKEKMCVTKNRSYRKRAK